MTVHQAKGLEFPVVVLWDGKALLGGRNSSVPWKVAQEGKTLCFIEVRARRSERFGAPEELSRQLERDRDAALAALSKVPGPVTL